MQFLPLIGIKPTQLSKKLTLLWDGLTFIAAKTF